MFEKLDEAVKTYQAKLLADEKKSQENLKKMEDFQELAKPILGNLSAVLGKSLQLCAKFEDLSMEVWSSAIGLTLIFEMRGDSMRVTVDNAQERSVLGERYKVPTENTEAWLIEFLECQFLKSLGKV